MFFYCEKKGKSKKYIIYKVEDGEYMKNEIILFENEEVRLEVIW